MTPPLWLIRTSDNRITGPVPQDQLLRLLNEGRLKSEDEVCPGHGYWFYLSERDQMKRYLGVDIRVASGEPSPEEVTDTQILIPQEAHFVEVAPSESRSAQLNSGGFPLEKTAFLKTLAWVLVIGVAWLVYHILHLLKA